MNYIKVIDLGHVIEVYEMERIPVNPHEIAKKDDYCFSQDLLDPDKTKENNRLFYELQRENQKKKKIEKKKDAHKQSETLVTGAED